MSATVATTQEQPRRADVFVLSTGFHYYFSTLLIRWLGLGQVAYIMYQPREGIERRAAAAGHRVISADARDPLTRMLGKKAGKWHFAGRAFAELGLAGQRVRVFSPYYNDTLLYALRRRIAQRCTGAEYNMIPDGAALLRHLPGTATPGALRRRLSRWIFGIEPTDTRHKSGSWSPFLEHVYHFPASRIEADPARVVIVEVPDSTRGSNGQALVLGGLGGISLGFVRAAKAACAGLSVRYRMHPKNRTGEQYITAEAPDWRELELSGILEEHLLDDPYALVIGHYSSSVMFNHLFVTASRSRFIIDRAQEDPDYHATADACGIPVELV